MKLLSWNVNGIRAIHKKGFLEKIFNDSPDIVSIQENKAHLDVIPDELKTIPGYFFYSSSALKKGYSGVSIWTKVKPIKVERSIGVKRFDNEGRVLISYYKTFTLFNIYFPNGGASPERLKYKLDFYENFLDFLKRNKLKKVIVCGDFNTAHKEIDLARPKENSKGSGFLPIERAWMDKFTKSGFIDTFRIFNEDPGNYTWWDYKTRARERNVGWRIDYFFISKDLEKNIVSSSIKNDIFGSDHCPIDIEIFQ